jgi:hypothetical protein
MRERPCIRTRHRLKGVKRNLIVIALQVLEAARFDQQAIWTHIQTAELDCMARGY